MEKEKAGFTGFFYATKNGGVTSGDPDYWALQSQAFLAALDWSFLIARLIQASLIHGNKKSPILSYQACDCRGGRITCGDP